MESISAQENKTVGQKIVEAPVVAGELVVEKTETLGHDLKTVTVESATVVVDSTRAAASDIVDAGKELARNAEIAVTPSTHPAPSRVVSGADTVVA
jgi:hypothetical protein